MGVAQDAILAPVRAGSIELAQFVASYVAGEAPFLTVLGLPMIAGSVEQGQKVMEAVRDVQARELESRYDLRILATLTSTPLQLYLSQTEYEDVSSLSGLRIRTLGSDQEFFVRAFGATPMTIPVGDLVTALSTNRVDGVIAGTQYFLSQNFIEYGPNMLAWNAILGPGFLVVGNAKWNELSAQAQEGILRAAQEFEDGVWRRAMHLEEEMQAKAVEAGFVIHRLSEEDRDKLTELAQDAWQSWASRSGPLASDLLESALKAR